MRKINWVSCPGGDGTYHPLGFRNHLEARHPEIWERYSKLRQVYPRHTPSEIIVMLRNSDSLLGLKSPEVSTLTDPNDPVNHPSHYTFSKYEVLDVLQEWFPADPLLWQVVKYVARANYKGNRLQDLKKAKFYLEREIEKEQNHA